MKLDISRQIRKSMDLPIVGVIGATNPDVDYSRTQGIEVGYALREYFDNKKGTIFTGGVDGVGVDVYTGVVKYCINAQFNDGKLRDDKFFLLVPKFEMMHFVDEESERPKIVPYIPPQAYFALSSLIGLNVLNKIVVGNDMAERRKYVGDVADALIVVNGGFGTLDEAYQALSSGNKVITLPQTGGAANVLGLVKRDKIPKELLLNLRKNKMSFENLNLDLLYDSNSVGNMIKILDKEL